MHIENSNVTIQNTLFDSNTAQEGGAININCNNYESCDTTINDCLFSSNTGTEKGGAIYYNFRRPQLRNLSYSNNTASYGSEIASYPVRIVMDSMIDQNIAFDNIASGIAYSETVKLLLVDYDNQVMNLVNNSQVKISPITSGARMSGIDSASLVMGQAEFDSLQFVYIPGQPNIQYRLSSNLIDSSKVSYLNLPTNDTINVSFRY